MIYYVSDEESKYIIDLQRIRDGVSLKFKTIEGNLGAIKINKYLSGLIIYINQFRW